MIPDADIEYEHLSNFELIGRGIFGVVYKASYLGTEVAVKECFSSIKQYGFDFEKVFNREVSILKECRHPNIVQYMGTCIHDDKFYIITEYVKNGNLKTWITERIDELPWKLRVNFAIDIARALAYLHSRNIMHRDIKPENILITENGRAKICDFGFSRFVAQTEEERRRLSYCGTETYMAPEVILCMDFNESVDVFGYGMILCEMIAGNLAERAFERKIPGFEIDPDDIYNYYKKDPQCPEEFVKLAIQCTKYEVEERPSWRTIITTLNEIDETIENSYNIGIIPAAGLISNDFLIPLSPAITGQNTEEDSNKTIKKANSVKSLNIDTEELKKMHKKKFNGRPTSPVLNTRRLSNQYYYYYAINNPTSTESNSNSNHRSSKQNIYRRLPMYITPPIEHSSIIAVPKDIPKISINSPIIAPSDVSTTTNTHSNSNTSISSLKKSDSDLNSSTEIPLTEDDQIRNEEENNDEKVKESEEIIEKEEDEDEDSVKDTSLLQDISSLSLNVGYTNNKPPVMPTTTTLSSPTSYSSLKKKRSNTTKAERHPHFYLGEDEEEEEEKKSKSKNKNKKDRSSKKEEDKGKPKENNFTIPTIKTNKTKHISLPAMSLDIRLYPNAIQKRKESLLHRSSKLNTSFTIDTDKTLTMTDNSITPDTPVSPSTIEDIYHYGYHDPSEKENKITGIHHRFTINYRPCLSKCSVCRRRMSLVKRHLVCDDCNYRCHAKCSSLAPFSCTCTHRKEK